MEAVLGHFGYLALFAALAVAGIGVPLPEELTQLTAGALAHEGILDLRVAIPVIWAGIVTGDALLFFLARRHGPRLLASRPARKVLTPARRERLQRHFARHAFWTVAVFRHAGGVRFAAFALAGASGVRPSTFFLADGLSALVSVPIVSGAGYLFWQHLSEAHRDVRRVELALLAVGVIVAAVVVWVRRRRERQAAGGPGGGGAGPGSG